MFFSGIANALSSWRRDRDGIANRISLLSGICNAARNRVEFVIQQNKLNENV